MRKTKLIFITSNPQKAIEVGKALQPYGIEVERRDIDIPEIQTSKLEHVIRDKVEKAYAIVKKPVIVDDAGIFFNGYKDFPGVYSRFMFIALGFRGMFKLITNGQEAHFASFIGYKAAANTPAQIFSGRCPGTLTTRIKGKRKKKMPYDNIFIPRGDSRTFSQMSIEEKQQYDHRSQAVRKFARYLASNSKARPV